MGIIRTIVPCLAHFMTGRRPWDMLIHPAPREFVRQDGISRQMKSGVTWCDFLIQRQNARSGAAAASIQAENWRIETISFGVRRIQMPRMKVDLPLWGQDSDIFTEIFTAWNTMLITGPPLKAVHQWPSHGTSITAVQWPIDTASIKPMGFQCAAWRMNESHPLQALLWQAASDPYCYAVAHSISLSNISKIICNFSQDSSVIRLSVRSPEYDSKRIQ